MKMKTKSVGKENWRKGQGYMDEKKIRDTQRWMWDEETKRINF